MAITSISPDSVIDIALKPFLVWGYTGAASPVFKVQLTLATDAGYASPIIDVTVNDVAGQSSYGTYQVPANLDEETDYIWRVSDNDGNDWNTATFTTATSTALVIPNITSAHVDQATGVSIVETLKWIADDVNQVYIEIDDNPAFTDPTQHTADADAEVWDFTPLDVDTFYWLRIKRTSTGEWAVHQFYTGIVFALLPTINDPANGKSGESLLPLLDWDIASGAVTYQVQLSDGAAFSNLIVDENLLEVIFFQLTTVLQTSSDYYWRVRATNAYGNSSWSEVNRFTTIEAEEPPLEAPNLISPLNVSIDNPISPTFVWGEVEDATTYEIEISDSNGFIVIIDTADDIAVATYTMSATLAYDTEYFWRVRSKTVTETSVWSEISQLRTLVDIVPIQVVKLSPVDEHTGDLVQPTLDWTGLSNAETYEVEVATDDQFTTVVYTQDGITDSNHKLLTPIAYNTEHFWRVRGVNSFGAGEWSIEWSFTTAASSSAAVLTLEIKMEFNETTQMLTFIDNISTRYFSEYEIPLVGILGIFKIEGPSNTIYKNAGWDDDNFAASDIKGEDGLWTINDIVPQTAGNQIEGGTYIISYKVSIDAGVSVAYSTEQTYDHIYSRPVIAFSKLVNVDASTITLVDKTAYTMSFYGNSYVPVEGVENIRTWIIRYPATAEQPSVTGTTATYVIGPRIWTGQYDIIFSASLEYLIEEWDDNALQVIIKDAISGEDGSLYIANVDIEDAVYDAYHNIDKNFEEAKLYDIKEVNRLRLVRQDLAYYYTLYQIALRSGKEATYSLNRMKAILIKEKILVVDNLGVSTEIVTRAEYVIAGSDNIDPNIIYTEYLQNITDSGLIEIIDNS